MTRENQLHDKIMTMITKKTQAEKSIEYEDENGGNYEEPCNVKR